MNRMNKMVLLAGVASLTAILLASPASAVVDDFVKFRFSPAKKTGEATCKAKFPKHGKYEEATWNVRTNACWSCPEGYEKTDRLVHKIDGDKACKRKRKHQKREHARATKRGDPGCPKGSFRHGLTSQCYACPPGYTRTVVPGKDLSKVSDACVEAKVDKSALKNTKFMKWAEPEVKKLRKKHAKDIDRLVRIAKRLNTKENRKFFRKKRKHSREERAKFLLRLGGPHANSEQDQSEAAERKQAASRQFKKPEEAQGGRRSPSKGNAAGGRRGLYPDQLTTTWELMRKVPGWQSFWMGLTVDQSLIGGKTYTPVGWGWDVTSRKWHMIDGEYQIQRNKEGKLVKRKAGDRPNVRYCATSWSLGATAGFDKAFEIGFFRVPNDQLDGQTHGFVVGGGLGVGATLTFWWLPKVEKIYTREEWDKGNEKRVKIKKRDKAKFAGITVSLQGGVSAEAEYSRGRTWKRNEWKGVKSKKRLKVFTPAPGTFFCW